MTKIAIVLPTYNYNNYREGLIRKTFESLCRTECSYKPDLLLMIRPGINQNYEGLYQLSRLTSKFKVVVDQTNRIKGTEATLVYGTHHLFDYTDATHVMWLGDDGRVHPQFINESAALIDRHPDALGWTTYHSARQDIHTDLTAPDYYLDVQVKSICGQGMLWERKHWRSLGLSHNNTQIWHKPQLGYTTVDLWHAHCYPGQRWTTYNSYVTHDGEEGVNCRKDCGETALNFVGDE